MQQFDSHGKHPALRELVVQAATSTCLPSDASRIWRGLTDGEMLIIDAFHTEGASYLVIKDHQHSPLSSRSRAALERASRGTSQKALAIELGVAPSTLAGALKNALAALGLGGIPSRMPFSLAALVNTAVMPDADCLLRRSNFNTLGRHYEIVSVIRPRLLHVLSPAVREVVSMRSEGLSQAAIAVQRKTSVRTVANQMASAFQRLNVSGRSELVSRLTQHAALP